jgi:predicted AlkP superfamily phosphohydrolase/phosphomutase
MAAVRKVIVIGLDGLDPRIVEALLATGELPYLAGLLAQGGYARLASTSPAQTPVAWSSFATGTNPGGHGVFDFLRRDPETYLPQLALNRHEQKNPFVPPRAVNLRRGVPVWEVLSQAGVPSTVLRCPCTYPPERVRGRMLAGMGVPDLRGGLGTSTFYTSSANVQPGEAEQLVRVHPTDGTIRTHLIGPRHPRTGADCTIPLRLEIDAAGRTVTVHSAGRPAVLTVGQGRWSDWLRVKFPVGLLQSVHGAVRFYLVQPEPNFELYASPIQFDPELPPFPISSPPDYARQLAADLGPFYTAGMVEDHGGLSNGRLDETAFLDQCQAVLAERERMMLAELPRHNEGLFFCLFDTPDRLQHMFWRFREPDHPAHRGAYDPTWAGIIEEHYRTCDAIVGRALAHADDRTLVIVLSDHGFTSFRRGVHLNGWLHAQGLLALKDGVRPGDDAGDLFRSVDWQRTRAYAVGLGGIYLNLQGREAQGSVKPEDAPALEAELIRGLTGLTDPKQGTVAVRSVRSRRQLYAGPYAAESPDLVVQFAAGYRVSWGTALGSVAEGTFEDNVNKWSGDHLVDPSLVPGVLFVNRPFHGDGASLVDLAPTILAALGVPRGAAMEGRSLLA